MLGSVVAVLSLTNVAYGEPIQPWLFQYQRHAYLPTFNNDNNRFGILEKCVTTQYQTTLLMYQVEYLVAEPYVDCWKYIRILYVTSRLNEQLSQSCVRRFERISYYEEVKLITENGDERLYFTDKNFRQASSVTDLDTEYCCRLQTCFVWLSSFNNALCCIRLFDRSIFTSKFPRA
jgi:hypothetical protein